MTDSSPRPPLAPRHWPLWLGVGLLWLVTRLPYRMLLPLGTVLGRLLHAGLRARRKVVEINLALCFPELDATARRQLVRAHFEAMGMTVLETGLSWWSDQTRLCSLLTSIEGVDHIERALEQGHGVLLLGAHFTTLEISGPLLRCGVKHPVASFYRQHENPVIEYLMRRGRERHLDALVGRDNVRELIRILRKNEIIWYAPDQAYRGKGSAMVPFFGIPAPTNIGTSRIVKMSGAAVLPYFSTRQPGGGYRIVIGAPLEDFPGDDETQDTLRIHHILEDAIRQAPEQYFWVHKRFKGAHGEPDRYQAGQP